MRKITELMVDMYKMENYDWMYYQVSDEHPFTYHHLLVPYRKNKKRTIENGAILCEASAHTYIHIIETFDLDRYNGITLILKEINLQGYMTTKEQYQALNAILTSFEKEYSGVRNTSNKPLIKEVYTKRGMY